MLLTVCGRGLLRGPLLSGDVGRIGMSNFGNRGLIRDCNVLKTDLVEIVDYPLRVYHLNIVVVWNAPQLVTIGREWYPGWVAQLDFEAHLDG